MTLQTQKKIVILGAGVAGLRIAQKLGRRLTPQNAKILLVDENNYHQYLYRIQEVCNVDYEEKDIIVPISRLIKGLNVEFFQTVVKNVDTNRQFVETTDGDILYDILVIALGSHVAYFGINGLEENSISLTSYEAAKKIRAKIQDLFKKAEETRDPPNLVIGGGGFTGVELAGEIADWFPKLCKKHGIKKPGKFITIVEMMPTILPGWNQKLVQKGQKILKKLGVELILNDRVLKVHEKKIELRSGKILEPDLIIWTGGVRGDPACGLDFEILSRRIVIDEFCRALGYDNIYVAGDSACTTNEKGQPIPPTAHIAMVQGDIVSCNIEATLLGGTMKSYKNRHIGEIVTLGRTNAVGELYGIKYVGLSAKIMKKIVHYWYVYSIGGIRLLLGIQ